MILWQCGHLKLERTEQFEPVSVILLPSQSKYPQFQFAINFWITLDYNINLRPGCGYLHDPHVLAGQL